MKSLSVREMRTALTQLERLLSEEGEVVVTRRGKPIARILPAHASRPIPSRVGLRRRMKKLEVGSEVLIREDRDAR